LAFLSLLFKTLMDVFIKICWGRALFKFFWSFSLDVWS
jgi:hypothetical protein